MRCPASAPDLFTVPCELEQGHDGPHRSNQVIWWDTVPPADLELDTVHWVGGRVYLSGEATG